MVALDLSEVENSTLKAMNEALEASQSNEQRGYLGASSIGDPCERKLWYRFRFAKQPRFDAATLKRFDDGHRIEDVFAARLRLIPGIELWTTQENSNKQIRVELFDGHFAGHADGVIRGLIEAPKTPHVWEHKCVAEKKFKKLLQLKALGEKEALQAWDEIYYAQAVIYMELLDLTRHFLTVTTPGGREETSVRTNANKKLAKSLIEKARRIIFAASPPPRAFKKSSYYMCNWCEFKSICWEDHSAPDAPQRHCRTCAHSTPIFNGEWICERQEISKDRFVILDNQSQCRACPEHLFHPEFFAHTPIGFDRKADAYRYEDSSGNTWLNPCGTGNFIKEGNQQ